MRPEMPLLLGVAVLVYGFRAWRAQGARKAILLRCGHGWRVSAAAPALGRAECHFLAQAAIPRAALCHVSRRIPASWLLRLDGDVARTLSRRIFYSLEDRRRAPGRKRTPCFGFRFSRGKGASRGFDRAIQRQPRARHFSRNGSPICRNRPRADAAPPAANVRPRAVRTRPDDLVHAADRAVAHRRQILACSASNGRIPTPTCSSREGLRCWATCTWRWRSAESGLLGARAGKAARPEHPLGRISGG